MITEEENLFIGYVTKVHNATNFDIDIQLTDLKRDKYKYVYKSYYTAIDPDDEHVNPKRLYSYPCRVEGVSMRRNTFGRRTSESTYEIKQLFFLFNNWVLCSVGEVDYYNRILVKIYDPITKEPIMDYHYKKYKDIFEPYSRVSA